MGRLKDMKNAGTVAQVNDRNSTSYKTLGQLLLSLHGRSGLELRDDDPENEQKRGIFQKQHILNIAHSSMEPQREWMYMLYISDIPGRFWTDVVSNYPSFVKRMVSYAYAISVGTVSTSVYLGLIKLFALKGKTGASSPQQELVYRASSVTMPSRVVKEVETNYIGGLRANHPTAIKYEGDLSCTFEEDESAFILRQFHSWMDPIEEEIIGTVTGNNQVFKAESSDFWGQRMDDSYVFDMNSFQDLRTKLKTNIELYMFRYSGDDIGFKVIFYNCYPKVIGQSSWTYKSGGTISYTVNFAYDYFKIVYIPYPVRGKNTNNFRSVWAQTVDKLLQFGVNMLFMLILRVIMARKTSEMLARPQNVPNRDIIDRVKEMKSKEAEKIAMQRKIEQETDPVKKKELQKASAQNLKVSLNNGVDNTDPDETAMILHKVTSKGVRAHDSITDDKAAGEAITQLNDDMAKADEVRKGARAESLTLSESARTQPAMTADELKAYLKSGIMTNNRNFTDLDADVAVTKLDKDMAKADVVRKKARKESKKLSKESRTQPAMTADELKAYLKSGILSHTKNFTDTDAEIALTKLDKDMAKADVVRTKARAESLKLSKESSTLLDKETQDAHDVRVKARAESLDKSEQSRTMLDKETQDALDVRNKAREESLKLSKESSTLLDKETQDALDVRNKARAESLSLSEKSRTMLDEETEDSYKVRAKARAESLALSKESSTLLDKETSDALAVREAARAKSQSLSEQSRTLLDEETEDAFAVRTKARADSLGLSEQSRTLLDEETEDARKVREAARAQSQSLSEQSRTLLDEETADAYKVRSDARAKSQSKSSDSITKLEESYKNADEVRAKARAESLALSEKARTFTSPIAEEQAEAGRSSLNGFEDHTNLNEKAEKSFDASKETIGGLGLNGGDFHSRVAELLKSIRPGLNGGEDSSNLYEFNPGTRPGLNGGDDNSNPFEIVDGVRPGLNDGVNNSVIPELEDDNIASGQNVNIGTFNNTERPGLNGGDDNTSI